jgi:hypothetical protein
MAWDRNQWRVQSLAQSRCNVSSCLLTFQSVYQIQTLAITVFCVGVPNDREDAFRFNELLNRDSYIRHQVSVKYTKL